MLANFALDVSAINQSNPNAPFFILENTITVEPESNKLLLVSFSPVEEGVF